MQPIPNDRARVLIRALGQLTMQQTVLHHYPDLPVTYRFTNRSSSTLFSRQCIDLFRTAISRPFFLHLICFSLNLTSCLCCADFATITLTNEERLWLGNTCPYFTKEYLSYLSAYRFRPEQVKVKYTPVTDDNLKGKLEIDISGPWVETILWEVPLMACLSEAYFLTSFTDWNYDGQDGV
jgi:nicotinate phosphoribosyltransferase